ncbi:hypothetical protein Tco_0506680 [Tanacetum coccineum]
MPRRDCSDGFVLLSESDFKLLDTKGSRKLAAVHLPDFWGKRGLSWRLREGKPRGLCRDDCPDCEDSQFCHSSRVSHLQLQLGIRYPNLID